MDNIKVNVEGAPEAVAKFFKEMGQTQFIEGDKTTFVEAILPPINIENGVQISGAVQVGGEVLPTTEEKKTRKPRQKKEDKVEVTEEAPDSEFEGVPGEEVIEAQVTEREISLPEVKEALKEYGLWIVEQGHESASAKDYLIALLRKYGEAGSTKELKEENYKKVFDAAVAREPMEALEEWK